MEWVFIADGLNMYHSERLIRVIAAISDLDESLGKK